MSCIERNEFVGFGQPVIKGTRLTVYTVVSYAYSSNVIQHFLTEFELSLLELKAALSYCKHRQCQIFNHTFDKYCDGCILRSINDGWKPASLDFYEKDNISYSNDGTIIFLGSLQELDDEEFGRIGWQIEKKLLL
ncbi:MAG: DUF433 domain-containing protein [Chitinophaga sp.]|uniref:DUF433 domain-containing protein n=1 Tax=Chitinophaga sp. TaxID=1869181 RepID=UPI0025C49F48|nr:DUF433 domain-containing protein [Chitinophaga sp.]MBV8252441.1 DUF433 domain-containing protein [Chitinophaga sp.]